VNQNSKLKKVESNIFYLDSRRLSKFGVSGVYLVVGEGITLIETGTTLNGPALLESIREIGFQEKDVKRAIVTHIHLDHAGATGWLVQRLPHLEVYVHEKGLEHMHDPTKLLDSALTVYGNFETIIAAHGEILPVPRENLISVTETDLDAGNGVRLKMFDAPGHAYHHLCVYEPETGCLFSGEALGHYEPETDTISPALAPPAFDYEAALATIDKIEALDPRLVCFSQFGQRGDTKFVIEKSKRQLNHYYELIRTNLKKGLNAEEVIEEIWRASSKKSEEDQEITRGMLVSVVHAYQIYFRRIGEVK